MRDPTVNGGAQLESVVPFASTQGSNDQEGGADQLDKAGWSILHLLHRAAGVAEDDLPLSFHPVAVRVSAVDTPFGAV
jgi:hypothetical protein